MISRWLHVIREEFFSFTSSERSFILFSMLSSFLISLDYATIRPVSNALFLTSYGASFLPYAWLVAVPLNFLIVTLYNRYLPGWGCRRMFVTTTAFIALFNLLCTYCISLFPPLCFFLYVWKEIYIMLMFQQLWSLIHLTISFNKAKYLYGLFLAVGAFGAFCGSLLPSFLAVRIGSTHLLVATLPIYLLLNLCYFRVLPNSKYSSSTLTRSTSSSYLEGFKQVFSSKTLLVILCIVSFMQLTSSLIDFQFNLFLEQHIQGQDLRAQYMAKLMSIAHLLTISLQLGGAFVCIRYLGVKGSHLFIPLFLLTNVTLFQFLPLFGLISFSFLCIKSFDFSLFTAIKELLYIPLSPQEKFHAKSVIDVFAHRSAKAIGSLLILAVQTLLGVQFLPSIGWMAVILFVAWVVIITLFLKDKAPVPQD